MKTTYSFTTLTIEDGSVVNSNTEVFNVEGKDHNLVSVFNIIMSLRVEDVVLINGDDFKVVRTNIIIDDCDDFQHILQRITSL